MTQKHNPLTKPSNLKLKSLSLAIMSLAFSHQAHANIEESIENALKFGDKDGTYGQIKFDLTYRYEYADTDNTAPEPAHANTFRLRFGYLSPEFFGFQGFVEYENVFAVQSDYNGAGRSGDRGHHVVADPADQHELNRLWISFNGIPDTVIKGGRQRIKIDDDRFIGNVGWRQMEQTYDSVMITNTSITDLTVKAGYIGRVRNIFSTSNNMESPFVNINYKINDMATLIAYGYWLNYTDDDSLKKSSQTYGFNLSGSPKVSEDVTLHYTAEYSYQEDYEDNPNNFSLDRYNFMGGITVAGFTLKGAMEQLDGNGTSAFSTPLGTNHKFQGFADRFLSTPADGIRDLNVTLATSVMGAKVVGVYHHFTDDSGNIDFGDEVNALIVKKFGKHYSLLAKYAYYFGDSNAPGALKNDTQKIWLQANVSF